MEALFYGDDFTGSSDSLAQFHRWGLKSKLLFSLPGPDEFAAALCGFDVVGIAGIARALPTERMHEEILPVFESFARVPARLVQYKVCSTFDSSPTLGSFGRAIDLARGVFGTAPIPVLPAQPEFGRYTLFGNHFAVAGDAVYRLDRHPTMSRHPSTPMDESDLRLILARQTPLPIALFDIVKLRSKRGRAMLEQLLAGNPAAVVFDALENDDLIRAAELIASDAFPERVVAIGSGGLSYGIGARLAGGRARPAAHGLEPVEKLFVVSGSCAQQTSQQIQWALANGWHGVKIDTARLIDPQQRKAAVAELAEAALHELRESSRGVIVYSAGDARDVLAASVPPEVLGGALGAVMREAVRHAGITRALVAGGDTSSYAMRALGADGVEIIAMLAVAGSLCRVFARDPQVEGLEVVMKGGQVGNDRFFEIVRTANATEYAPAGCSRRS